MLRASVLNMQMHQGEFPGTAEFICMLISMEYKVPYILKMVMCLVKTSSDMKGGGKNDWNVQYSQLSSYTEDPDRGDYDWGMDEGGARGMCRHVIGQVDPFRAATVKQYISQGHSTKQQTFVKLYINKPFLPNQTRRWLTHTAMIFIHIWF